MRTTSAGAPSPGAQPPQSSTQAIVVPLPAAPPRQPEPARSPGQPGQTPPKPPSAVRSVLRSTVKLVALAAIAAGVYFAHARYERMQPYEWSGSVEAHTVGVGSRVGGRVKEVLVREGQQVERGDDLVTLETVEIDAKRLVAQAEIDAAEAYYEKLVNGALPAEVAQAYARLGAARASAEQAYTAVVHENAEQQRVESLFATGSVSTAERQAVEARAKSASAFLHQTGARAKEEEAALKLLTAGTRPEDVRAARAQLAVARAKLAQIDQQLDEMRIRAPNRARVESIAVRPGDLLKPDARALTILEAGQLYVRIYVPEPHLGKLHVGQIVPVSVDSFPDRTFKARIEHVNEVGEFTPRRLITTEDRADEVFATRLALIEGESELRAGMAAFIKVPK